MLPCGMLQKMMSDEAGGPTNEIIRRQPAQQESFAISFEKV
jgi:hypothetical protein